MKRLMYGSIALLCLALSFHLGATVTGASHVNQLTQGIMAFRTLSGTDAYVLCEDGSVWRADPDHGWAEADPSPCPVPVSSVKFWGKTALVTVDNHVWFYRWGAWEDAGAWPGGASATESASWAEIKARFR